MSYYKRFNRKDYEGFAPAELAYEYYKTLEGAIIGNDQDGEFVMVKSELVDEFVITALSRQDFKSRGFNADTLSNEEMQAIADEMAEHYIEYGSYWDDIESAGKSLGLEPIKTEKE